MTVARVASSGFAAKRCKISDMVFFDKIVKRNAAIFDELYIIAHAFDFVSFAGGAVGAAGVDVVAAGFFCDSFFELAAS